MDSGARDFGHCCFIFPIKFGVGLICGFTLASALVSVFSLTTGDIKLQGNGYDPTFYYLPSTVGALGVVFGLIGLVGVYDERPDWLRAFNFFLGAKLLAGFIAMVADYRALQKCETGYFPPQTNPQMYVLQAMGVCSQSRISYLIGCSLDFSVSAYFLYCTICYRVALQMNPHYGFRFQTDPRDVESMWRSFKVRPPTFWEDYPEVAKRFDVEEEPESGADGKWAPKPAPCGNLVGYGYYGSVNDGPDGGA